MTQREEQQPNWQTHTFAGRVRIEQLTGIRWFACLLVFLHHNTPGGQTPMWIVYFMNNGACAPAIFFVLSGFVLAITYADSLKRLDGKSTWDYVVARIARIYPLYLLMLLVALAFTLQRGSNVGRMDFALQLTTMQSWSPDHGAAYGVNPPGWTLSIEVFLYMCFPFLLLWLRPGRLATSKAVLTMVITVVSMLIMALAVYQTGTIDVPAHQAFSMHHLYRIPLFRLGDFILGIAAAAIYLNLIRRPSRTPAAPAAGGPTGATTPPKIRWAGPLSTVAVLVMVGLLLIPHFANNPLGNDVAFAVPTVALILGLGLATHTRLTRFMSLTWVVLLGELSYAFYLSHLVIQIYITGFPLTNGFTWLSTLQFLAIFTFIVGVSYVLWRWFAQPSRGWVRRTLTRGPGSAGRSNAAPTSSVPS